MTASDESTKEVQNAAAKTAERPKKAPAKAKKPAEPKKETAKEAAPAAPARQRKSGAIDIGIDVKVPDTACTDRDCPFHGTLPVRGLIMEGDVVSDKMQLTAVVKRQYMRKNRKYERLEKRSGKYLVHNPPCIGAETGDHVKIMECRPLSKKVSFVIVERMRGE